MSFAFGLIVLPQVLHAHERAIRPPIFAEGRLLDRNSLMFVEQPRAATSRASASISRSGGSAAVRPGIRHERTQNEHGLDSCVHL
jgi:hypothetical protein